MQAPSSRPKRSTASPPADSSADKRVKILLPDAELNTLRYNMKLKSDKMKWRMIVEDAEVDDYVGAYPPGHPPHAGIGVHKHEGQRYRESDLGVCR